jgi:hypothetical protein
VVNFFILKLCNYEKSPDHVESGGCITVRYLVDMDSGRNGIDVEKIEPIVQQGVRVLWVIYSEPLPAKTNNVIKIMSNFIYRKMCVRTAIRPTSYILCVLHRN